MGAAFDNLALIQHEDEVGLPDRAEAMGHDEAARLLQENLDEEKAADEKLSGLAEGGINQSAADIAHPDDEEQEPATAGAGRKSSSAAKSRRR